MVYRGGDDATSILARFQSEGEFGPEVTLAQIDLTPFQNAPHDIDLGDMDNDGRLDLLITNTNDTVDLLLIAVHPDYQKKGVNAIILSKAMKGCHKLGIKQAETGPMLELNDKVQSQWKDFQAEQHKRRRCFIKQL